jgi:hypothetical protein
MATSDGASRAKGIHSVQEKACILGVATRTCSRTTAVLTAFGGGDRFQDFDDTWAYDYHTNTWTEMHPATHPSAGIRPVNPYILA